MHIQVQLPAALTAIHNFIHLYNLNEEDLGGSMEDFDDHYKHCICTFNTHGHQDAPESLMTDANDSAQIQWARIVQSMWEDYQRVLEEHAHVDDYLCGNREEDEDKDEDEEGTYGGYNENAEDMV